MYPLSKDTVCHLSLVIVVLRLLGKAREWQVSVSPSPASSSDQVDLQGRKVIPADVSGVKSAHIYLVLCCLYRCVSFHVMFPCTLIPFVLRLLCHYACPHWGHLSPVMMFPSHPPNKQCPWGPLHPTLWNFKTTDWESAFASERCFCAQTVVRASLGTLWGAGISRMPSG